MHFGQKPRFEIVDDGTIIARAGTQTNSGGIAAIHVRINSKNTSGISLSAFGGKDWKGGEYGPHVPGANMPPLLRNAVYEGARSAYEYSALKSGLEFELIDAFVHIVDGNQRMFHAAGEEAILGWVK